MFHVEHFLSFVRIHRIPPPKRSAGVFHVEHSIRVHQTMALLSPTRSNYSGGQTAFAR
jgi:hypothetical protein